MVRFFRYLLGGLLWLLIFQAAGNACTTFQLDDDGRTFVGTNYDWGVPDGLVIINPRGLAKTAMPSYRDNSEVGRPAKWASRYGSVTFNQYGREMPFGGMNEAGLVIGTMGLFSQNKFPAPDNRPSIYMQQWLQYQLDNHATVDEVIQSEAYLRIRPKAGVHIHFLVSDREGRCAAIEYIDGRQVVHAGPTLPHRVLTNSTYDDSLEHLAANRFPAPDRFKSIERFVRAARRLEAYPSASADTPLDFAFALLEDVSWTATRNTWTSRTQWRIVYDVDNRTIHFMTHANPQRRRIDLKTIDFDCARPARVLDVNADYSGDVTDRFVDYTRQMNRDLTASAFNQTVYLPRLSEDVFDNIAQYPDTFVCGPGASRSF